MEEGRQKSRRLSYTAKFKREVIRCAEDKGNRKAAANFRVDESKNRLWRKHKAAISGCEALKEIHWTQERTARTPALSFFQNPALDRESNLHSILIRI
jgi:hypothetical protein